MRVLLITQNVFKPGVGLFLTLVMLLVMRHNSMAQNTNQGEHRGYKRTFFDVARDGTNWNSFVINKDFKHANQGSWLGLVAQRGSWYNQWNFFHRHDELVNGNHAATALEINYFNHKGKADGNNRHKSDFLIQRLHYDRVQYWVPINMMEGRDIHLDGGSLELSSGHAYVNSGAINFGSTTRQMLNLWNNKYGIGVQSQTLYFRSNSGTNEGFAWYHGGAHDNGLGNPGSGGKTYMVLRKGRLGISGDLGNGFNPTHTLDVNGNADISNALGVGGLITARTDLNVNNDLRVSNQIETPRVYLQGPTAGEMYNDQGGIRIRALSQLELASITAGPAGTPANLSLNNDGTITTSAEFNSSANIRAANISVKGEIVKDDMSTEDHLAIRGDVKIKALANGTRANLFVDNEIKAEDFEVTPGTSGAPDYVFADDYELLELGELAQYVTEHHHLPNVPSAKEIEEEGYNVTAMDFDLLEKVEELTLYILELNEQNHELRNEIRTLKSAVQSMMKD